MLKDNLKGADPLLVAPTEGDFTLKPDSPAPALGFKQIPWSEIGLVRDAFRNTLPKL